MPQALGLGWGWRCKVHCPYTCARALQVPPDSSDGQRELVLSFLQSSEELGGAAWLLQWSAGNAVL